MSQSVNGWQTKGGRFFTSKLEADLNETEETLAEAIEVGRADDTGFSHVAVQDILMFLRNYDKLVIDYLNAYQATLVKGLHDDNAKTSNSRQSHTNQRG